MDSQTFITKQKERIENSETLKKGEKRLASLMADDNIIYSYGYHYPLLFQVTTPEGKKIWVCNNSGYSNTTAKHISLASWQADICVEVSNMDYDSIKKSVENKIQRIISQIDSKKRTDTNVYRYLVNDLQTQVYYLEELTN